MAFRSILASALISIIIEFLFGLVVNSVFAIRLVAAFMGPTIFRLRAKINFRQAFLAGYFYMWITYVIIKPTIFMEALQRDLLTFLILLFLFPLPFALLGVIGAWLGSKFSVV